MEVPDNHDGSDHYNHAGHDDIDRAHHNQHGGHHHHIRGIYNLNLVQHHELDGPLHDEQHQWLNLVFEYISYDLEPCDDIECAYRRLDSDGGFLNSPNDWI